MYNGCETDSTIAANPKLHQVGFREVGPKPLPSGTAVRPQFDSSQRTEFGFDLGALGLTEPSSTFLTIAMRTAK
jgi:hypothetical protein